MPQKYSVKKQCILLLDYLLLVIYFRIIGTKNYINEVNCYQVVISAHRENSVSLRDYIIYEIMPEIRQTLKNKDNEKGTKKISHIKNNIIQNNEKYMTVKEVASIFTQ